MNSTEAVKELQIIKKAIEKAMTQGGPGVAIGYDMLVDRTAAIDAAIRALEEKQRNIGELTKALEHPRGDVTHRLKTWPEYFEHICDGTKNFEIRINDRDFRVGDTLLLEEYDQQKGYTGRYEYRKVTYILDKQPFVSDGYVCMSLI